MNGNQAIFRDLIKARLPQRVDGLVSANLRRIEFDAFRAWTLNQMVQMNPQTGVETTSSLNIDAARYVTLADPFDTAANAFNLFVAWVKDAIDAVGPLAGVMLRQAMIDEIVADAPQGVAALPLTVAQTEERIRQTSGGAFRFFPMERTLDLFDDAGTEVTRTKIWPADRLAAIPAGGVIGNTAFAPVARAYDIAAAVPSAKVDVRGMTVYYEAANLGRELTVECQVNPFSMPDERNVYVGIEPAS